MEIENKNTCRGSDVGSEDVGSSLGIPQGDVHKILIDHNQQILSHRIEGTVSLKSLPLNIRQDIDVVCPTSNFFTNTGWAPFDDPVESGEAEISCRVPGFVLVDYFGIHRNTLLNPPAQIWGSMKFGVRSLALCCLLRCIWCYAVLSVWNSACSPRTLEWVRSLYLATHHVNYTCGCLHWQMTMTS